MSPNQPALQNPSTIISRSFRVRSSVALLAITLVAASSALLRAQTPVQPDNPNGRQGPITFSQIPTGANGATQAQAPTAYGLGQLPGQNGVQNPPGNQGSFTQSMAVLYPDPTQYILNTGDLISVRLYGIPDYIATVRISKDGTVQLPLLGSLNLAGITIRQAQDLIDSALKAGGMFRNPDILLGIIESSTPATVTFAGEKSGVYPLIGQRSLIDILAAAGGLPATASRVISIIRPGEDAPITINLGSTPQELIKANIPILPRDTIFVERSGVIYVLGAFKQQGAYPLPVTGMSLMQAASLAGGAQYAGKYNDLRLVRTTGTQRTEVKVDIKRIQYGQDPDPLLQSGDILFLPTAPLKAALAANGLGTLLSAISVLLIAIYQR